ncbi:type II toxin-antitoxin system RelE/ParE family toxin [Limnoraphis robusta Tam1]|jgi:putative addiction module killer protein|uniref:Type II toxin-antitoxin system RelE/ParE family toxin n=1 Tax=Limnoraphis robusta CCNP1315 TaxID=3110306 RepID=A0ABU5TVK2_9CYAN|nr:type II toxin-antitoxin system RelE/ParE family toxin [Limnoraphis robusta]MEA5496018.1 type II toxin-antitoxin system RelE/ParE family toxin [Limnoraphis robusta BA-68 BA1]MEA5518932.1 type II toxin-antitoxin system RelE/ParE family toxin [Limnoraphis robusta CCNP1315]MEA5543144.1 type II toxin-antitoxin system RelE/ParE family toxin [Limnoraphis robusta Tam1]MEA5548430.1 type II toxin-antitoxin system RelE/ParE family toxin [Limnoraphis robusta CCNP1324]
MEAQPREIQRYIKVDGKIPFSEWIDSLQDRKARLKIKLRLDRVEEGNLGDYRSVGEGVFELRLNYGPGYRIYFGQVGLTIILLLCGGDKKTQVTDIQTAKKYWRDYNARNTSSNQ